MSKAQKNRLPLAEALAGVLPEGKFWEKAWSLVEGCTPVSRGCDNCWLAGLERCYGAKIERGATGNFNEGTITGFENHTPSPLVSGGKFNGKIRCREDRLNIPLKRQKPTVYAIWSDLMHEDVPDSFRDQAFAAMALAPQHWFIIVTKRPEVATSYLKGHGLVRSICESAHKLHNVNFSSKHPEFSAADIRRFRAKNKEWSDHVGRLVAWTVEGGAANAIWKREEPDSDYPSRLEWPLSNVIILVTMEDQGRANERAPYALKLSSLGWTVGALCEPLLSDIDLTNFLGFDGTNGEDGAEERGWGYNCYSGGLIGKGEDSTYDPRCGFDWLITGGESGHGARPAHPAWIRSLRDQAQAAGLPFMLKQNGEWCLAASDACHKSDILLDVRGVAAGHIYGPGSMQSPAKMSRLGKKAAGRLLDGKEYLEVPNA